MFQDLFPVFDTFSRQQTRASAESSGQTDSHFIDFRTNPAFKSAHQAQLQGCFPIPTNNAPRELLGNTSPIYTFSEAAWNRARAGFLTACLSKPSSQGHENCPSAQSLGQTDSQPPQERGVLGCELISADYLRCSHHMNKQVILGRNSCSLPPCVLAECPIV